MDVTAAATLVIPAAVLVSNDKIPSCRVPVASLSASRVNVVAPNEPNNDSDV